MPGSTDESGRGDPWASMVSAVICLIKTFTRPTVYTTCGLTVSLAEASGWASDITCQWCLTHTVRSGEHDDSMHDILAGQ